MGRTVEMQICLGSSCFSRGNRDVVTFVKDYLRKNHLDEKVLFRGARCMGHCSNGPNMIIDGKVFEGVNREEAEKLLEQLLSEIR